LTEQPPLVPAKQFTEPSVLLTMPFGASIFTLTKMSIAGAELANMVATAATPTTTRNRSLFRASLN
jgi:hypothetical protein